jgi:hypothetical protein
MNQLTTDPEQRLADSIVQRSARAAETGDVWTSEDHARLIEHLRKIDELAEAVAARRAEGIRERMRTAAGLNDVIISKMRGALAGATEPIEMERKAAAGLNDVIISKMRGALAGATEPIEMERKAAAGLNDVIISKMRGALAGATEPIEMERKAAAFDWLGDQCVKYGMGIRPLRAGIGLVSLKYMSQGGEYVYTRAHNSLYQCCVAAMGGEEASVEAEATARKERR